MYYLRIDGINFPVAPESITTDHKNKNQTVTLANEKEINILKKEGLKDFTFDVRLPDREYSWAYWEQPEGASLESGFNEPAVFVDILQSLKKYKKPFLLIIVRDDGVNFEEKVTLESLSTVESNEGTTAPCSFKQYVDFVTKVKKNKSSSKSKTSKTPKKKSYTVKKGDTLKKISKKMYGTQNYASKIYKWNKTEIEAAAKKNGRKSSESGKHLYKGTKLKLKTIK